MAEGPAMTTQQALEPSARVRAYTDRFAQFLAEDVAPIEQELSKQGAGTPDNPALDAEGRMHPAVWEARRQVQRRAGKLGLHCPHIQERFGGGGFGRVEMHHVEEFIYRHSGLGLGLAALAWTEGASPPFEHVSEAAREKYLLPLVRGEITTAFANTEPNVGSDVLGMETYATRDGSDWILNGRKAWITNAHFADVYQVVAVTDPGKGTRSLSMFLVDAKMPGFSRIGDQPTLINDGLTGRLQFENVRIPAENIVSQIGDGFALAMSWINWRRLCRGGMCAGWGEWLVERAITYAHERKSGGKPLAQLQAVQHLIARMDADVYQARAASLVGQARLDQIGAFSIPLDREAPRLVSLVKMTSDEAFYRVCDNAVQMHGANGMLRGTPEEKLFRVARNLRIPAGATEIQLNAVSRTLLKEGKAV
ncbi:acyl-CoA dehydrogenase [Methylobacterium hispanicum]|uniref:acyl-CoA dehydrogenase family protein n=1 Tax=Methylobacterium hispanicum TaxID=270350 RepID=UPI002F35F627